MPIYTVYERATNTKVAYSQVYIRHDHTYVRDLSSIIFIQYMYVMHVDTVYHGAEVYMELGVTRLQGCKYREEYAVEHVQLRRLEKGMHRCHDGSLPR